MTGQKSFKGRIRARMDKTSERYTTARRQLMAKAGSETPADAPRARRPYSDEVIRANTGRTGTSGSPCSTPGVGPSGRIPRSPGGWSRSTVSAAGRPRA